eukprot:9641901-Lingulodinium_polyedra.AAC.1
MVGRVPRCIRWCHTTCCTRVRHNVARCVATHNAPTFALGVLQCVRVLPQHAATFARAASMPQHARLPLHAYGANPC